jgi:hypothetical protein
MCCDERRRLHQLGILHDPERQSNKQFVLHLKPSAKRNAKMMKDLPLSGDGMSRRRRNAINAARSTQMTVVDQRCECQDKKQC